MNAKLIATLLVVVLATAIGVVVGVTASSDNGPTNAPMPAQIITVSGGATVQTEPDKATVNLGVSTDAATSEEALKTNADKTDAVMKSLKANGVEDKDIQTTNVSLNKHYTDRGTPKEVVTYRAETQITVIIRDLPKVGDVIDGAVAAGANNVRGVEFGLSSETAAKSDALKQAVDNAEAKARTLATAAGATLGPVVRIDEESYNVRNYQYRDAFMSMDSGATLGAIPAAAPSFGTSVAPGEVSTSVSVHVTFQLEN
jgi:uncharacterized protein YggE